MDYNAQKAVFHSGNAGGSLTQLHLVTLAGTVRADFCSTPWLAIQTLTDDALRLDGPLTANEKDGERSRGRIPHLRRASYPRHHRPLPSPLPREHPHRWYSLLSQVVAFQSSFYAIRAENAKAAFASAATAHARSRRPLSFRQIARQATPVDPETGGSLQSAFCDCLSSSDDAHHHRLHPRCRFSRLSSHFRQV